MPFWIQGWLEVTTDPPENGDAIWQAMLDLSVLIDTGDSVSERLFGLSKSFRSQRELRRESLFAERGWPATPSATVAREREMIEEHESRFGMGEYGGYSFATLAEILAADVADGANGEAELPRDSDWQLVFNIADLLVRQQRYQSTQIRFVVWFNW